MQDDQMVDSSSTETANALESFTDAQRAEWLLKGTPQPKDEAEPAPAKKESGADKPETIAPATDTGKTGQEPKQSRAEQRKAELAAEIQDLLRQRAELRGDVDAGKKPADKPPGSAPAEPAKAKEDGEPVPPDPTTWTGTWEELEKAKIAYLRELTKWELGKGEREREAAAKQSRVSELQQKYKARADAALAEDPEFADAQDIIGKFVTAKGVSELILESEVGPEIVMHLYKLPHEEQQRVAALSSLALARELTRLEATLSKPEKPAAPQPKRTSAARAPATELGGKNAGSTVDDAEQALAENDYERYARIMNERAVKKQT